MQGGGKQPSLQQEEEGGKEKERAKACESERERERRDTNKGVKSGWDAVRGLFWNKTTRVTPKLTEVEPMSSARSG